MVELAITRRSAPARVLVLGRTVVARKVVERFTVVISVAKTAAARKVERVTAASSLARVLEKTGKRPERQRRKKVARHWTEAVAGIVEARALQQMVHIRHSNRRVESDLYVAYKLRNWMRICPMWF